MSSTDSNPLLFVVAGVLINDEQEVLLAQRPNGKSMAGLWEFPGGKIHPNEIPEEALVRELQEELGIVLRANDLKPLTFASHAYPSFHLFMPVFICRRWEGTPHPREEQTLAWVKKEHFQDYKMPPADLGLISEILKEL